jgi:serine/threonine protein kinase
MDRLKRIESLFHRALELEEERRPEFLERECEGDEDLIREVKALLESDSSNDSFLEEPAVAAHREEADTPASGVSEGSVLGRHELLSPIGVGGMGFVYKARDLKSGQIDAVKVLAPQLASSRSSVRRFLREAKAVAGLQHPAVARILNFGEKDGTYFIAMEYVDGETLNDRVARSPFSADQVADILVQVVDALKEAHKKGIIHRDLKPSNLMIKETGEVKILDFGLVKVQRDMGLHAEGFLSADSLTLPGTVLGTVNYMSPEQAMGRKIDPRSDIFSLGVIAYELLTGRFPFQGKSVGETLDNICHRPYIPIARFNLDASDRFEAIVGKCLRKDPDKRYRSAKELAKELRKVCGYGPGEEDESFGTNKMLLYGAGIAIALVLVVLVVYWVKMAS